MNKLIVFDWNGTLLSDTMPSWKASNDCLTFFNAPPITLKHFREIFDFPIVRFYEACGVSEACMLEQKEQSNVVFQTAYENYAKHTRLRTGARELLEHCKTEGHKCIILSNYVTDKINTHLKRLKIDHYFDHVCAHNCDGTTILQSTTKPKRLKTYMEKNKIRPENTIIIGDSLEEPEIGRTLDIQSIGITDGYISRKRLRQSKPNFIVHTHKQIKKYLTQL